MFKVIKTYFLLFLFLGLIPSCCPEVEPYFIPAEMEVYPMINGVLYSDIEDPTIESADDLEFWIEFTERDFVAESKSFSLFQNQALATQPCPDDGHEGLKSPVTSMMITSNSEFQGIAAGESLNDHFHVLEPDGEDDEGNQSFTEVGIETIMGRFQFLSYYEPYLSVFLTELPGNNLEHVFTLELSFEDGSSISAESIAVQF